jgi:hypothetical protein
VAGDPASSSSARRSSRARARSASSSRTGTRWWRPTPTTRSPARS